MSEAEVTIGAAALQILKVLVGNAPKTCDELAQAFKVSRTAVNIQLDDLLAMGLVACTQEKLPNRGRPHYLYKATEAALAMLFAHGHRMILPLIWQAVSDSGGKKLVDRVMARLAELLAARYNRRIKATQPIARLKRLIALLHDEGVLIEVRAEDGSLTIRRRSCPFVTMADKDFAVCELDAQFFTLVLGCPVCKIACRRKGDACCVFELVGV